MWFAAPAPRGVRNPCPTWFNLLSFNTSTSTLNHLLPKLNCWLTCLPSLYWPPPSLQSQRRSFRIFSSSKFSVLFLLLFIILYCPTVQSKLTRKREKKKKSITQIFLKEWVLWIHIWCWLICRHHGTQRTKSQLRLSRNSRTPQTSSPLSLRHFVEHVARVPESLRRRDRRPRRSVDCPIVSFPEMGHRRFRQIRPRRRDRRSSSCFSTCSLWGWGGSCFSTRRLGSLLRLLWIWEGSLLRGFLRVIGSSRSNLSSMKI